MHIQHLRLPKMDEESLKKALAWETRGKFPFDPSQAVLRHVIAGEIYHDQEPKFEVVVMAARRDLVEQFLAAAAKARLDVAGVNVESKAIIDCFSRIYRRKADFDTATLFVDIGCSATRVVMMRAGRQASVRPRHPDRGRAFQPGRGKARNEYPAPSRRGSSAQDWPPKKATPAERRRARLGLRPDPGCAPSRPRALRRNSFALLWRPRPAQSGAAQTATAPTAVALHSPRRRRRPPWLKLGPHRSPEERRRASSKPAANRSRSSSKNFRFVPALLRIDVPQPAGSAPGVRRWRSQSTCDVPANRPQPRASPPRWAIRFVAWKFPPTWGSTPASTVGGRSPPGLSRSA